MLVDCRCLPIDDILRHESSTLQKTHCSRKKIEKEINIQLEISQKIQSLKISKRLSKSNIIFSIHFTLHLA